MPIRMVTARFGVRAAFASESILNPITISGEPASPWERRLSCAIVVVLLVSTIVTLPFHRATFGIASWFIPSFAGATGMADAFSSILLFGIYRIDGKRFVLAAAAAFSLDALLIVPYTMTYPHVVTATGYLGNEQSAATLWLLWHLTFPALIVIGTLQTRRPDPESVRPRRMAIVVGLALLFALACGCAVTVGHRSLPVLVRAGHFQPLFSVLAVVAALANVACIATLASRRKPLRALDLWFVIASSASVLDSSLNSFAVSRYSAAWYVGKIETFVTASVIFVSLIVALCARYARSAALVRGLLEANAERDSLRARLEREHEIALALQDAALPRMLPTLANVRLQAVYRPAIGDLQIGGDWYDAFETSDGSLVLTIGDVSGKGLAASLVMGRVRQSLRLAACVCAEPGAMLALADTSLRAEDPETIVTAFVGVLARDGTLAWASAGHPCPLVRQPDGRIEELYAPGLPLGLRLGSEPDVRRTALRPGALLVMYTDGLVEANRDYLAGSLRLASEIEAIGDPHEIDVALALYDRLVERAQDDVAILALAIEAPATGIAGGAFATTVPDPGRHEDAVA